MYTLQKVCVCVHVCVCVQECVCPLYSCVFVREEREIVHVLAYSSKTLSAVIIVIVLCGTGA